MENLEQMITVVSAGLGLIATVTGFLIPLVKNVKAKNRLTALNQLSTLLKSLIVEAEKFSNFTGEEKKEYVMTKANRYALENNILFDESTVGDEIEKLIDLSKNVNNGSPRNDIEEKSITTDKYKIG